MAHKVRVTVKEKILVHLLGFIRFKEDFEVPPKVTQDGMASVIGVRRSHIASALKGLKESEFVTEQKTRIEGQERRKNAYFLTPQGEIEAQRIKGSLMEKEIRVSGEDGTLKEVKISELSKFLGKKMGLLEILSQVTPEGIFQEKEEEKPKEPERRVACPFCGQINYNFELRQVQLLDGRSGVNVPCTFCGNEFMASEVPDAAVGALNYQPAILPIEEPKRRSIPTGNPLLVSLGLLFMMGSFILALLVGISEIPGTFCLLAPIGIIISLVLLYAGLKDVRHLNAMSRRVLFITGTIFVSFVALFSALILGASFESQEIGVMAMVIVPAFGFLILGRPISSDMRSELALSLGVFLVMFGLILFILSNLFPWPQSYSPFWIIAGAAFLFTSYEIHRLNRTLILRGISVGGGAFFALLCLAILNNWYSDLGPLKIISIILWLLVALFLVVMRFIKISSFERMFALFYMCLISGIGLLFALTGILFALSERFMEAGVEFFIGVPIMWYGLLDFRELSRLQLLGLVFVLATEAFSVFSFILT
jgi:DNA-directed RNA polymerase subunit M/transcription elongation factor TFIIS